MRKNVVNGKKSEFVPGRTFRATVKTVRRDGVLIKMPGGKGSGTISPRCWGSVAEREKALAAIRPGDEFDVVVRSYDARTMTLSLVLVGREHLVPLPKKDLTVRKISRPKDVACPRKPDFVPLAVGTTFLWDASNLLGVAGVEDAARMFSAIASSMSEQGYKTMFFIERRCLTWAQHNQRSQTEVAELDTFVRRDDVVIVGDCGDGTGEADCAILQMAEALPESVCVTRDRYEDYAHAYPGIVGTNRIRSYSVAKVGGKTMILVNGVAHAIVVENVRKETDISPDMQSVEVQTPASAVFQPPATTTAAEVDIAGNHSGLFAIAEECVRRGDAQGAVRLYGKLAKRDPAAYRVLAGMYRDGTTVRADGKKAALYERLARAAEKRRRERSLRDRRVRAEAIRCNRHSVGHFAAKRRKALSLAIFAGNHEMICEYRKLRWARHGKSGIRGRAA